MEFSNITALEVMMFDDTAYLFASTRYDGTLTSWDLSGGTLDLVDTYAYAGVLQAGGTASITQACAFSGTTQLGAQAARLSYGQTMTLGNGNQAIFGARRRYFAGTWAFG